MVAIHESGIYAMTVKDWEGLRDFFMNNERDDVLNNFRQMVVPGSLYTAESAFLSLFGQYLNLYKSSIDGDLNFNGLKQNENDPKQDETIACD